MDFVANQEPIRREAEVFLNDNLLLLRLGIELTRAALLGPGGTGRASSRNVEDRGYFSRVTRDEGSSTFRVCYQHLSQYLDLRIRADIVDSNGGETSDVDVLASSTFILGKDRHNDSSRDIAKANPYSELRLVKSNF